MWGNTVFWRFEKCIALSEKKQPLGFGLILLNLFSFKNIHCAMRWRKMACLCWHKSFVEGRNPKVGIRIQILPNHCIAPMVKSLSNNHLGTIHILRKHIFDCLYPLYVNTTIFFRKQNMPFSNPFLPYKCLRNIYEWSLDNYVKPIGLVCPTINM